MRFCEFIAACGAAVLLSAPIAAAAQEKTAPDSRCARRTNSRKTIPGTGVWPSSPRR